MRDPVAPLDAFAPVTIDQWRAKVGRDLAQRDRDGLAIEPLYTAADLPDPLPPPHAGAPWQIWLPDDEAEGVCLPDGSVRTKDGSFFRNCDPLAAGTDGLLQAYDAMSAFVKAAEPGRAITISTLPYHEAGAHVVEELACLLATASAYRSAMGARGIETEAFAAQCLLRVAVGRDLFREIAKLRAARRVWSRLTGADAMIHAVCSERTLTRVDPWVNMMRVTTQAFAAASGGADAITTQQYDAAGAEPADVGRRLARNTLLVLRHESGLGGGTDPAHGSYYVEALTDRIARAAWSRYLAMEAAESFEEQRRDGSLREAIDHEWNKGALPVIRTRQQPITGVSEYPAGEDPLPRPDPTETDLPRRHDADPFEELRDLAASLPRAPSVRLVKVGTPREFGPAFSFARNFFLAGGFKINEDEGDHACVCGVGAIAAAVLACREAGARRVLVAGAADDSGADAFVHQGIDAVALLRSLLDEVAR
ncbi:MAG: methylmalonyl-CoA mutase family protein [Planctomycetota bacterium]